MTAIAVFNVRMPKRNRPTIINIRFLNNFSLMITEIEVKLLEKSEELLFLRGVCMKIGLRTVKTAISAALAMIIAEKLGLLYAPSAGLFQF